jgi:hypothetical protein
MTTLFSRNAELDEKECWYRWMRFGSSLQKVSRELEAEGIISQRTEKRYSATAILHAAWRYAMKNPDDAYAVARYFKESMGEIYTEDDWKRDLVKGADLVFQRDKEKVGTYIAQMGLQAYV